jgi:hypothetical protein
MMWRLVRADVPSDRRALPSYVLAYFDNLVSEYDSICCWGNLTPDQKSLINRKSSEVKDYISKREKKELTWRELFIFEKLILHLQPLDRLRRRAWHLRSQFASVFGRDELIAYLSSKPPDPLMAEEQVLRADLEQILSRFHWLYTVIPDRERIRDKLSQAIITTTFMGVFEALLILFIDYILPSYLGPLVMVPIMGVIGSCVSMQRRLQTVPNTGDPIVNMEELNSARSSVTWTPLTGAIFAALIYLMFLGGLLEGSLFPKITSLTTRVEGKNLGLLLIWAFIAGFAERMVPDALDRIVGKYQGEAKGPSRAVILPDQVDDKKDGTGKADADGPKKKVDGSSGGPTGDGGAEGANAHNK